MNDLHIDIKFEDFEIQVFHSKQKSKYEICEIKKRQKLKLKITPEGTFIRFLKSLRFFV